MKFCPLCCDEFNIVDRRKLRPCNNCSHEVCLSCWQRICREDSGEMRALPGLCPACRSPYTKSLADMPMKPPDDNDSNLQQIMFEENYTGFPCCRDGACRRRFSGSSVAPSQEEVCKEPQRCSLINFSNWYRQEADKYRLFLMDDHGQVPLMDIPTLTQFKLIVTNSTKLPVRVMKQCRGVDDPMPGFDRETLVGNLKPKQTLQFTKRTKCSAGHVTTFIFREATTNKLLLRFIPVRPIPTTRWTPTTTVIEQDGDQPRMSLPLFLFELGPPSYPTGDTCEEEKLPCDYATCGIVDPVFYFSAVPKQTKVLPNPLSVAYQYAVIHCFRMGYGGWWYLQECLNRILLHPNQMDHRMFHRDRDQHNFFSKIWDTPARGILLAFGGFEEIGNLVAFKKHEVPLSPATVHEVSNLVLQVNKWRRIQVGLCVGVGS